MENRQAYTKVRDFFGDTGTRVIRSGDKDKNPGFPPRKAKAQPKRGSKCPACGLQRSVTGKCFCNE